MFILVISIHFANLLDTLFYFIFFYFIGNTTLNNIFKTFLYKYTIEKYDYTCINKRAYTAVTLNHYIVWLACSFHNKAFHALIIVVSYVLVMPIEVGTFTTVHVVIKLLLINNKCILLLLDTYVSLYILRHTILFDYLVNRKIYYTTVYIFKRIDLKLIYF